MIFSGGGGWGILWGSKEVGQEGVNLGLEFFWGASGVLWLFCCERCGFSGNEFCDFG